MRAGIFFVAFVVMTAASFQGAAILLARWVNPYLIYVPAALVAAALMAHARVPPRLPANPAWYAVLAVFAAAVLAAPFLPVPLLGSAAKLLLIGAVVAVLLRLTPRIGDLYQSTPLPGFLVFVSLTALLFQSVSIVTDLAAAGITHPEIARIPGPMANLAAAAIVVVVFIMASGIRQRSQQLNPSKSWLVSGMIVWVAAATAAHVRAYAEYAAYALIAAHLLLFIGAFYMLSHLLPSRGADRLH